MACEVIYFENDNQLRELFGEKPTLEQLGTGYGFSEGPVWHGQQNRLYFTDFPNEAIHIWEPDRGASLYRGEAHRAIGLCLDNQGNVLACESRNQRVAMLNPAGSQAVVDSYDGKAFNSVNDVVVAKNGDILFSDPFSQALGKPSAQGFNGVYHYHSATGQVSVVSRTFAWPNGLCLSRDESRLYVNDTGEQQVYVFERLANGSYGNQQPLLTLDKSHGEGAPDGMKVDRHDNLWVTGPGGVWVFAVKDQAQAKPLALVKMPEFAGNFCFGGPNGDQVFFTASSSLYRLQLTQPIN